MPRRTRRSLPRRRWAMLAYIAGDNDLSDFGLEDIREMEQTGSSSRSYAAVQIDTRGAHDGSVRYEISEPDATGAAHRVVIDRLPESDSGNPDVLHGFLHWGLERYQATNTLAVVWNHGAGFRTVRRDIAFDDYGTSLDMNELEGTLARAGLGPNNRLAILGFDACLMNMLEIAHHLRRVTRLVVGSEQTEPGDGWPYHLVLEELNSAATPEALARGIVRRYMNSYRAVGDSNVTQSAVRTDRTDAAIRAMGAFGLALKDALDTERGLLRSLRSQVQSYEFADYVDAVHLAQLVAGRSKVAAARARGFAAAVQACVIANGRLGSAVRNSNGLSIWFPSERSQYLAFRGKYTAMDFPRTHDGWVKFLDAFHS